MSLEKQKRVLVFFPSCVGLSPVPHQGEERLKLPFKDYLARWILAAPPPLFQLIFSKYGVRQGSAIFGK